MSVGPETVDAVRVTDRPFGPTSSLQRRVRASGPIHRYSRFVAWMKLALPTAAMMLVLLVVVWPRIQSAVETIGKLPRIDLSQARDLRMVNLHYSGRDKHNRPFTVTADSARQQSESDDLIELDGPKSDMTTASGSWLALNAYTGVYRPQSQLLDLFGNVEVFQDKGNEFVTDSAHIDMAKGNAEGNDPVEGHGPFGSIKAEGFRIEDQGDTIIFTGKTELMLEQHGSKAEP